MARVAPFLFLAVLATPGCYAEVNGGVHTASGNDVSRRVEWSVGGSVGLQWDRKRKVRVAGGGSFNAKKFRAARHRYTAWSTPAELRTDVTLHAWDPTQRLRATAIVNGGYGQVEGHGEIEPHRDFSIGFFAGPTYSTDVLRGQVLTSLGMTLDVASAREIGAVFLYGPQLRFGFSIESITVWDVLALFIQDPN